MNNSIDILKHRYNHGLIALGIANKLGGEFKGKALALLNKARGRLLAAQSTCRKEPHFDMYIDGMRCWIHVESYYPAMPATWDSPSQPEEFDYFIVDSNGHEIKFMYGRENHKEVLDNYLGWIHG